MIWLWLSALVILLDQVTKYFALHHLAPARPVALLPFLNLSLSFNAGASFGFLNRMGGWQVYGFAVVSLVVALFLIIGLIRSKRINKLMGISIALIIGGALGNFIDRVRLKFVIDFLDFHVHHWHFATFNIADSAVCVGAFLLVVHLLFFSK